MWLEFWKLWIPAGSVSFLLRMTGFKKVQLSCRLLNSSHSTQYANVAAFLYFRLYIFCVSRIFYVSHFPPLHFVPHFYNSRFHVSHFQRPPLYFRFLFRDFADLEGWNLPTDQISARNLNPRLRYYYFRFLKSNVCHVGILFCVSIFTFASPSACHSASVYQIFRPNRTVRGGVISIFKMAAGRKPYWIFSKVTADHPWSANEGLSLVLKFLTGSDL